MVGKASCDSAARCVCVVSALESKRVKERGWRESTPARKGHTACSAVRYSHRHRSIEPTPILYTHIHTHTQTFSLTSLQLNTNGLQ